MKKFVALTIIFSSISGFAQTVDAGADTIICPPETVDLTAVFVPGAGTDVPSTTSYSLTDIPFAPDAYAGTAVALTDDSQTGLLPIGFTFDFYGNSYTDFVICSNNWIGFSTGETSTWVTNTVPNTGADRPKNCIMGPWQDINPSSGGNIMYQTLGVAPCRRLVVTYENVPMFSCTSMIFAAQIILYEGSNIIENHIEAKPICASWNGGNAVQALHNIDGTVANVYTGRNNTNWTVVGEAAQWSPAGPLEPFPYTVEWYDAGTSTLIGTGTDITVAPIVTTDYAVVVSSCLYGTIATDTVTVFASCCEAPDMTFTDVTCFGANDGTATADGMGTGPWVYQWDDPLLQTTATAVGLAPGTYNVTVTDALGCIETGSVTISEPDVVDATLNSFTGANCDLLNGEIDVSAVGGVGTLEYTIDGGTTWFPTGVFTGLDGGAYTVTVEDDNGCSVDIPVVITDPPILSVVEVVVDEECMDNCDGSITLVAGSAAGPFTYSIDGGGTSSPTGVFNGLCDGVYNVEVIDENGCEYTNVLTVAGGPAWADATITPFGPLCSNDPVVTLTAVSPGGNWSGPGVSGTSFNPAVAGPGTHTITYSVPNPCGDIQTFDVTVYEIPVVVPTSNITDGCHPLKVIFSNGVTSPGDCVWDFGDGTTVSGCAISHEYDDPGVYDVTLSITNGPGCVTTTTASSMITVYEQPNAEFNFGPQPTDELHGEITFTDASSGGVDYLWIFDEEGSSTATDPTWNFTNYGNYEVTLQLTGDGGCYDEISKVVVIDDVILFYVPNIFTPDGDDYNETFQPVMTQGFDHYDYHFTIFNKWGEVVFESYNASVGWDGSYGDRGLVQDGTYIWQIEFRASDSDKRHEHRGHVTILK